MSGCCNFVNPSLLQLIVRKVSYNHLLWHSEPKQSLCLLQCSNKILDNSWRSANHLAQKGLLYKLPQIDSSKRQMTFRHDSYIIAGFHYCMCKKQKKESWITKGLFEAIKNVWQRCLLACFVRFLLTCAGTLSSSISNVIINKQYRQIAEFTVFHCSTSITLLVVPLQ